MHYKQIAFATVLLLASAGWAMAQGTTLNPTGGNPPILATDAPSTGSASPDADTTRAGNAVLEPGANNFTEGQARHRIEDHGYTSVGGLRKDQNSIWQVEATKNGRRVLSGVDFHGNVVEENR